MIELFIQCCERFLARDADMISRLQQHGFDLVDDGWHLTVPELHRFLSAMTRGEVPSYKSFRQQLFNSAVNTRLAEKGGVVVVANSTGKVDRSTYRLQRISTAAG